MMIRFLRFNAFENVNGTRDFSVFSVNECLGFINREIEVVFFFKFEYPTKSRPLFHILRKKVFFF